MKKVVLLSALLASLQIVSFAQMNNAKVLTIFTSHGCGCTGSGGAPASFSTHDEVFEKLRQSCTGTELIRWDGSYKEALDEIIENISFYDGVLIIGSISRDYRLAFTGLPTIVVYNLFEFMDGHPYNLFKTGNTDESRNILKGGTNYSVAKVLTAQLDRRNTCNPVVRDSMFNDLVYKIKLIKVVKDLKATKILIVRRNENEVIASVNYRGDINQFFPHDHNDVYIKHLIELFGIEIVQIEAEEFYSAYRAIKMENAAEIADKWIRDAMNVEASRSEIIKTARGYLALDALREKYGCNAVSTHIRSISGSGELKDLYNPGLGLELGFKTRGIQAICQNYPDLLLGQVLGYLLTGRPSMLGDFIYDMFNSTQIVLHCGIPINPYGDNRRIPYIIKPHAESPVRDIPQEPGSSTGLYAEWPVGESVTFWEVHAITKEIRLHTGEIIDGKSVYNGGEDLNNVMCTSKIVAKVKDSEKLQLDYRPYLYGIHCNATLGDLRQQIRDVGVLLGINVIERDN